MGRSWQHLPTWLGLLPPATRGLVLITRTLLGSQHPLLAKERFWGFALLSRWLKRSVVWSPQAFHFNSRAFSLFLEGRVVRSLKGCKCHQVGQEKGEIAPRCQGCRSLFCPWLKKDGIWLHWSCSSLRPAILRQDSSAARGNHRQLPRNGARLSSLRHLLNLALFSGICYPFLGFSFVLAYSQLPSHFLYTRCSQAKQGDSSVFARSMVSTKYSGTGFVT